MLSTYGLYWLKFRWCISIYFWIVFALGIYLLVFCCTYVYCLFHWVIWHILHLLYFSGSVVRCTHLWIYFPLFSLVWRKFNDYLIVIILRDSEGNIMDFCEFVWGLWIKYSMKKAPNLQALHQLSPLISGLRFQLITLSRPSQYWQKTPQNGYNNSSCPGSPC